MLDLWIQKQIIGEWEPGKVSLRYGKMENKKMQAVIYTKTGGLDVVKQQSIQMPRPGDNQVLVEVKACALNIGDYQRFQTKNGKIPISTRITNKLMGYVGKPLGAEIAGM